MPTLLLLAAKVTILFVAAWIVAALLRHRSAAARHLVWMLAIGLALLLPVAAGVVPSWAVPGVRDMRAAAPADAAVEPKGGLVAIAGGLGAAPATTSPPAAEARAGTGDAAVTPLRARRVAGAAEGPSVPPAAIGRLIWAGGSGLVLLALVISLVAARRLRRGSRPAPEALARRAGRFAGALGIRRPVDVLVSDGPAMPLTWGVFRPTVLLPAQAVDWEAERLDAVLVHELAHVRRWDCASQLVARIACALYWWHPLAWHAARKLREERELACDDVVLRHGARASSYADHLLALAHGFRAGPVSALVGIAMARPSQLAGRLLAVLDHTRARAQLGRWQASGALAVALALLVPVAGATSGSAVRPDADDPGPAEAVSPTRTVAGPAHGLQMPPVLQGTVCDWRETGNNTSVSSNSDDDRRFIHISLDDCEITVRIVGRVTFTDDERDVAAIAKGGRFEVEERAGNTRREARIRPGAGGLERHWFVDGKERAWDAEAGTWLASMLLVLYRRAGVDAEARATRILERGGTAGLLREIAQIHSSWTASKYYGVLLDRAQLSPRDLEQVIRDAAARIDSDHALAELLVAAAKHQSSDEGLQLAYVAAADSIDSDYEQARVLGAILARPGVSQRVADAMLTSASRLDSDHSRAELLIDVADRDPGGQPLPPSYLAATRGIDSDYQKGRVLETLLRRDRVAPEVLAQVFDLVGTIESDHQAAEVLVSALEQRPLNDATRAPFFRAVRGIGSSYDLGRVLQAVAARDPDPKTVAAILETAPQIESDYQLAEVLTDLAQRGLVTADLKAAYLRAAEGISSRSSRTRALEAIGMTGAE
jgi:beta-lactamase regulating signal transducer with metallopeptidase domain